MRKVSGIIGAKLIQLAVGEFIMSLNFDNDYCISIESPVVINGTKITIPAAASLLIDTLGKLVLNAQQGDENELMVSFDNQKVVIVTVKDDGFESYSVTGPDRSSIIV
jgi:hypothetical protein